MRASFDGHKHRIPFGCGGNPQTEIACVGDWTHSSRRVAVCHAVMAKPQRCPREAENVAVFDF